MLNTRRVNFRLLLALLALVLVLGSGSYCLHSYQVRHLAAAEWRLAEEALGEGRRDKVLEHLARYLGYRPRDADALALYGMTVEEVSTTIPARLQALVAYEAALQHGPPRDDLRRRAMRLALGLGQPAAARRHLDVLQQSHPGDPELEVARATCFEAEQLYANAAASLEKALRAGPQPDAVYVRLAAIQRDRLRRPDQADKVMDALVKARPNAAESYLARATHHRVRGQVQLAEADLARAQKLAPENPEVLRTMAQAALAAGRGDEARQLLTKALATAPRDARLYTALAAVEVNADRVPEAIACLRRGLEVLPRNPELLVRLTDVLLASERTDEATDVLDTLRRTTGSGPWVRFLEARLGMRGRRWREAADRLEGLARQPDLPEELAAQVPLYLGRCYYELGDPEKQASILRQAVGLTPGAARIPLGNALLASGDVEGAVTQYRELMARPGAPAEGWLLLARALLLLNLARPATARNWSEIDQALTQAEAAAPEAPEVPLLRAEVQAARGDAAGAGTLLDKASRRWPDRADLWAARARLAGRQGDRTEALRVLDEARKQLGDRIELRLARIALAMRSGTDAPAQLASLEQGAEQFPPAEQLRLLENLAEAWFRVGRPVEATRLWRELATRQPDDLKSRFALFDLAVLAQDAAASDRWRDEIRRLEGQEGTFWRYADAVQLLAQARRGDAAALAQARQRQAEVAQRRRHWHRSALLRAQIEELAGNPEAALESYQAAIDQGERQPAVLRRVLQLLTAQRRYIEAERVLQLLQQEGSLSRDLALRGSDVALRAALPDRALELVRLAVASDSRDYRDHMQLGRVLLAAGQTTQAEAAFHTAVTLADREPEPRLALVQLLAATGKTVPAETALKEASLRVPPEQLPLLLAEGYAALGQWDRAEEHFEAALKARPGDVRVLWHRAQYHMRRDQFTRAEPFLRQLLAADAPTSEPTRAWARRMLAVGLGAAGPYAQFRQALDLLAQNLRSRSASLEDQRAQAWLLATRPGHRTEGLRRLEELKRRQALLPDERFLLARLNDARGHWAQASEEMESLLATRRNNPQYVGFFVRGLLQHGQVETAAGWLDILERVDPQSFQTMELRARLLHARGQGAEAEALLLRYAARVENEIGLVAALAEELGRPAARGLYERHVQSSGRPEAVLALVGYLARRASLDEALAECEKAWKTCPPEKVAGACLGALHAGKPTPEQIRRVAGWLEQARSRHPQATALTLSAADLLQLERRYDEAEPLYRQVLERDPNNVAALNNFAWQLLLREGQEAAALELLERAIAVAGPLPGLLDTRALAHLRAGRHRQALEDLQEAVMDRPTGVRLLHLAQARNAAQDRQGAAEALRQARSAGLRLDRLSPLERPAYDLLARTLEGRK